MPSLRRRVLPSLFDLLYTRFAWSYDAVAWLVSAGHWYRWAETLLPFVPHGPVLEVGCGRGRLLPQLAARGYRTVGLDRSPQMARHAARQSGQPVVQGDGMALPFTDGQFATLITTFPAPYVLHRQAQREFARVVRPGGLWLWVDAPALERAAQTTLARAATRTAYGRAPSRAPHPLLGHDATNGLWAVQVERLPVGPTTVALRRAVRQQGHAAPQAEHAAE